MSIMANAKMFGGGPIEDDATYPRATVTNRGNAPNTLTHMVLFRAAWPSGHPSVPQDGSITEANDHGRPKYGRSLRYRIRLSQGAISLDGYGAPHASFVGIIGSHDAKTLWKRVRRPRPPANASGLRG